MDEEEIRSVIDPRRPEGHVIGERVLALIEADVMDHVGTDEMIGAAFVVKTLERDQLRKLNVHKTKKTAAMSSQRNLRCNISALNPTIEWAEMSVSHLFHRVMHLCHHMSLRN